MINKLGLIHEPISFEYYFSISESLSTCNSNLCINNNHIFVFNFYYMTYNNFLKIAMNYINI